MAHSPSPGYEPGNHWVECMRCGFDRRASEIVEDRQRPGLWVCKDKCFDMRHPGEFVRVPAEKITADPPVHVPPTPVYEDQDFEDQQVTIPAGTFNTDTL